MKQFLFILFLITIFFSCTDEQIVSNGTEDGTTYTTGYLSVDIENPSETITRSATWEYDDYFATSEVKDDENKQERWRHNLSLAYFDSDFKLEHFNIDTISNLTSSSGIASDVYGNGMAEYMAFTLGMQGLNITTGAHYFYILSNLPANFMYSLRTYCRERVGELTKDEFEKLVLTPSALNPSSTEEYMVEEIAGKELYANTGELKRRNFMSNVTSPTPRYLAPHTVMPDAGGYPAVNGFTMTIGKAFAKVSVAYVQKDAEKQLSEVEWRIVNDPKHTYMLPNIFKGQVQPPHYEERVINNDYQTYFANNFNPNSSITNNIYLPDSTNFSWREVTLKPADQKNHAYCLENGNETPLQGNSTMVLVKAKYTPAQWTNPDDNTPDSPTSDGTFWRIRNSAGNYLSGYYTKRPSVGSSQTAVEYKKGITYYPIWLQTDGMYMVERNHFYKIAITGVVSAGAPDLDSVMSPLEPLDDSTGTKSAGSGNNLPEIAKSITWEQKN